MSDRTPDAGPSWADRRSRRSAGRRCRCCSTACCGPRRPPGSRFRRSSSWTTGPTPSRRSTCRLACRPRCRVLHSRRARPGGGAQRRLAGRRHRLGGVPRRRRRGLRPAGWPTLGRDLRRSPRASAASRAGSRVPLPADRRPTDWERGTAGLETARLDHRGHGLPHATSLAGSAGSTSGSRGPSGRTPTSRCGFSTRAAGWSRASGRTQHPVRPAGWWASLHATARQRRRRTDGPAARPGLAAPRPRRRWADAPLHLP